MTTQEQRIADGKVVTIHYTLTDDDGSVLDSSQGGDPLDYLHGAHHVVPGLEAGLRGKGVGERVQLRLPPEEGYGVRDPKGIQRVPRAAFPADLELEPGMQFSAEDETGRAVTVWIEGVDGPEGQTVRIDQNHPLAGKTLCFDVHVTAIRDATLEELSHGHVHGPHGHHH
jgi:FKBP-type peptidyl-prolyl cis-trans isomerase SlyD